MGRKATRGNFKTMEKGGAKVMRDWRVTLVSLIAAIGWLLVIGYCWLRGGRW